MIDFDNLFCVYAAVTRTHLCVLGKIPYDNKVKDTAKQLVDAGDPTIFVQCLANGNLDMPDEVVTEAKVHYDILFSKQVES